MQGEKKTKKPFYDWGLKRLTKNIKINKRDIKIIYAQKPTTKTK